MIKLSKILSALTGLALLAMPAFAQEAGPKNFEYQLRQDALFTRNTYFTMGKTEARNTGFNQAWCNAIGTMYRLNAPLNSSATAASNAQITLPINTMITTGKGLKVRVFGTTAANANAKTVNFIFGSTTISIMNAAAANAKDFYADIEIFRTGASAQYINVAGYANGAFLNQLSTTSAQTETAAITVGVSVPTSTAAGDVVLTGVTILGESG